MHYAISTTWGPTDPTRAALPFVFALTALQAGDSVTVMLFHDAVHLGTRGTADKLVPFGPPQRFAEVVAHPNAKVYVCKPCAEVRHIGPDLLVTGAVMGGMVELHAAGSRPDAKFVSF